MKLSGSRPRRGATGARVLAAAAVIFGAVGFGSVKPAFADSYVPISGAGSTWSQNALNQWIADVNQYGMRVNYAGTGSSDGRRQFLNGTVDFAASDIPFQRQPEDGSPPELPIAGSYAYIPVTSGGTVFMYNLTVNGQRVTALRLSDDNIVKIFTGVITNWNDPALQADNPLIALPNRPIVPVVRSDGSGSTAQFSLYMVKTHAAMWNDYCHRSGRAPACGFTSYYPTLPYMKAVAGDLGVASYVAQSYADGAIGYVNYSYALNAGFPVAKMLNSADYYTEPTPQNVAVSLLQAQINTNPSDPDYLTQILDHVYADADPRTYRLSSYSYMILPTTIQGRFSNDKGKTLGAFAYYGMCQGQQESASLGYSPMPINLVQASFDQIRKIPGVVPQNINIQSCHNPTFSSDGHNVLADTAPSPPACDKRGPTQCLTGTGGARGKVTSATKAGGAGAGAATGTKATGGGGAGTGGAGNGSGAGANGNGANSANAAGGSGSGSDQGNVVCDPDSGVCTTSDSSGSSSGDASALPVTLAGGGWTQTTTLMVLALLLTVGIVIGPGIVSRYLARKRAM